jgi:hypothetical protein
MSPLDRSACFILTDEDNVTEDQSGKWVEGDVDAMRAQKLYVCEPAACFNDAPRLPTCVDESP